MLEVIQDVGLIENRESREGSNKEDGDGNVSVYVVDPGMIFKPTFVRGSRQAEKIIQATPIIDFGDRCDSSIST
jgi:hypothetical protein